MVCNVCVSEEESLIELCVYLSRYPFGGSEGYSFLSCRSDSVFVSSDDRTEPCGQFCLSARLSVRDTAIFGNLKKKVFCVLIKSTSLSFPVS